MSLKLSEELCFLTLNNDAKLEEELTYRFQSNMGNSIIYDKSTQNSKLAVYQWASFEENIIIYELKITEDICFMTLNSDP